MNKPGSLRALLALALPDLARDPDRLLVFIDKGSLRCTFAAGQSFEYSYTLTIIITDFGGHPDAVFVPLLDWIRVHQSELLASEKNRDSIAFECDVLANDKVDFQISLPLTERVGVHRQPDGKVLVEHYPEPLMEEPFPPMHWQLYVKEALVAEWDAPGG